MSVRAIFESFLNLIRIVRANSKNVHFNGLFVFGVNSLALARLFKRKAVYETPLQTKSHTSLLFYITITILLLYERV
jgi:hypothetical protein